MAFGLELISLTLAAGSAYAILMFVLKREVQKKPVVLTTSLTVLFTAVAMVSSYEGFSSIELGLSTGFLGVALLLGMSLLVKLRKAEQTLNQTTNDIAKNIGMFLFTLLCADWLIMIYFLAF